MKVLVIDYGMGNVGSVKRALEECGATEVVISNDHRDFADCTHAVLPGVGAFPDAMKHLREYDLVDQVRKIALEDKVPFLGICLGMQLLASSGEEITDEKGLDLIPGKVQMLVPVNGERVPHVGWNEIGFSRQDGIFDHIGDRADFYFVHSYHFIPANKDHILATTPYCGDIVTAVRKDNIMGMQFHPEKSSATGFQLLKNFLDL